MLVLKHFSAVRVGHSDETDCVNLSTTVSHRLPVSLRTAYSRLCTQLASPSSSGCDSFYVRVNMDLDPHGDPPCLGVRCDDILHVMDTLYNGKYQWHCARVDPHTAKHLQAGVVPNYNRYQNDMD